jgi:hypothetical protein
LVVLGRVLWILKLVVEMENVRLLTNINVMLDTQGQHVKISIVLDSTKQIQKFARVMEFVCLSIIATALLSFQEIVVNLHFSLLPQ